MTLALVRPAAEHLPSYAAALRRGWSPDNIAPRAADEELARIAADPAGFLAALDHRDPAGATITLPDGSRVPRLPGFRPLDMGRRARRLDRPALAARQRRPAAARARPRRLRRRPLEAPPRLCHPRPRPAAARGARARPRPHRDHHRARKPRLATGHRSERRRPGRSASKSLQPTAAGRRCATTSR